MHFSQFLDYLLLEKKYSSNTVKAYEADLVSFSNFILQEYEQKALLEINYPQIRSWIIVLVNSGLNNRSINRKISSLKAYYNFLLRTEQIDATPLAGHKSLKVKKSIQIPFSASEVENVLDNIPANSFEGARDLAIITLFYSTGIRRTELIGIKLQDVNLRSKTLKVLGKRNKERYLPLLPEICLKITAYLEFRSNDINTQDPHLFVTSNGVKMYDSLVYRIINNYFSEASNKVKKSPHILRHSFATHLLNEGANLNAVKELLGHSSLAATQVYTHSSINELSKVHKSAHPRQLKK